MKPDKIIKIIEYIKEQTDFKGDIFININSNAIPIKWIEKQRDDLENKGYGYASDILDSLLDEWFGVENADL